MKTKILKEIDYGKVREEIMAEPASTSIYIGCDSKETSRSHTRFITCVVIHHKSCNGAKCYFESIIEHRLMPLKERLLKEVHFAVKNALELVESAMVDIDGNVVDRNFEVHLDINPKKEHGSNVVFKQAVGFVEGQGLKAVVKPYSYAASAIADYVVNGLHKQERKERRSKHREDKRRRRKDATRKSVQNSPKRKDDK